MTHAIFPVLPTLHPVPALFALLAGAALLLAGRRLFWLFVGALGFFAGLRFALPLLGTHDQGGRWIVALAAGLLGVVLAIFLQRAAVALAGFVVGGWAATALFPVHLAHHPSLPGLLIYLLGGVLAALLALRLFEAALVVLSAFGGAALIVDALGGAHHHQGLGGLEAPLLLGLALLGVIVQAGLTARRGAPRRT